ncbi:hypothetical protein BKA62DRAFT_624087, partial [Auriculariales sp. MPI-PUGE-AT-0066]
MNPDPGITYPAPQIRRGRAAASREQRVTAAQPATPVVPSAVSINDLFKKAHLKSSSVSWAGRFRAKRSSINPAECLDLYRQALRESSTFVYAIDPRTYVAEVYDPVTLEKGRGVDAWVIQQGVFDKSTGTTSFSCCKWCPDKSFYSLPCLHELILANGELPSQQPVSAYDNPSAVAFRWTPSTSTEPALIMFCVMSPAFYPTIVSFNGFYSNAGVWACKKCRDMSCCIHIEAARKLGDHELLLGQEDEAHEESIVETRQLLQEHIAELRQRADRNSLRDLQDERSISYRPVPPPRWSQPQTSHVRLSTDPRTLPPTFQLGPHSRCRCGAPALDTAPVTKLSCVVYGPTSASKHLVCVKPCSRCPRERNMFAGPDLGGFGIFNYNNTKMFLHVVLNEYSTAIARMEAPFHAYTQLIQNRYVDCCSPIQFVSDDLFRAAWFSRARLIEQVNSMHCDICGDEPECVIFDGQTGGFDADMKTSLLRPPTTIMPDSVAKLGAVKPARETAAVTDGVGKRARMAVRWRQSLTVAGHSRLPGLHVEDIVDDPADGDQQPERAKQQQRARISKRDAEDAAMWASLGDIAKALEQCVCTEIASMFRTVVVAPHDIAMEETRQPYLEFLAQVFAHESVLQFLHPSAFTAVHWLLEDDPNAAAALLVSVPALGVISRLEFQSLGTYSQETKKIAAWLMRRSASVLSKLPKHSAEAAAARIGVDPAVVLTGSCWGRPRIRSRPSYANLPGDNSVDRSVVTDEFNAAGIGCSKFYEMYGKHGQTGGIMAAWCP